MKNICLALTAVFGAGLLSIGAAHGQSTDLTSHQRLLQHYKNVANHYHGNSRGIGSWQPAICQESSPSNIAEFVNVGRTMPLFINMLNEGGAGGAQINLPAGIPCDTFSFDVIPTPTSSNVTVYVVGVDSTGHTFGSNGPPNSIKGKTQTWDLLNLNNATNKSATPGSTISKLYIDCFDNSGKITGTVYVDNPKVNGRPIKTKIMTLITCPGVPFFPF
jgi:hypothetical protein